MSAGNAKTKEKTAETTARRAPASGAAKRRRRGGGRTPDGEVGQHAEYEAARACTVSIPEASLKDKSLGAPEEDAERAFFFAATQEHDEDVVEGVPLRKHLASLVRAPVTRGERARRESARPGCAGSAAAGVGRTRQNCLRASRTPASLHTPSCLRAARTWRAQSASARPASAANEARSACSARTRAASSARSRQNQVLAASTRASANASAIKASLRAGRNVSA